MTRDEADANLHQAIIEHAQAYEMAEDDVLLDQYAIVAAWQPTVSNRTTHYTTSYSTEYVASHVAVGLFRIGLSYAMRPDLEDE